MGELTSRKEVMELQPLVGREKPKHPSTISKLKTFHHRNPKSCCCCWWIVANIISWILFLPWIPPVYFETKGIRVLRTTIGEFGGKVPVEIHLNGFDSNTIIESVKFHLLSLTRYPVTVYYGTGAVATKTKYLPENVTALNLTTAIPKQGVNYYNDTPVYALNGSTFSYTVIASINSSKQGCGYLYLFNTSSAFETFLNRSRSSVYYNKSECIKLAVKGGHSQIAANLTITIRQDMFLYGAFVANVSANVNVTINGHLKEYDVSSLKSKQINGTIPSIIDLCSDSFKCSYGSSKEAFHILIESLNNVTIIIQDQGNDVSPHILAGIICATVVILAIIISLPFIYWINKHYNNRNAPNQPGCPMIDPERNRPFDESPGNTTPQPTPDVEIVRRCIYDALDNNYSNLSQLCDDQNTMKDLAARMFAKNMITELENRSTYKTTIKNFKDGFFLLDDLEKVQEHFNEFTSIFTDMGGPFIAMAHKLTSDINKKIKERQPSISFEFSQPS